MKKITKILSVLMVAVMALTALNITVFADSIEDTATKISSGKEYSTTLHNRGDEADYKISVSKSGTLKIKFTAKIDQMCIYIFDSNGNTLEYDDISFSSGKLTSDYNECIETYWNYTMEKCVGTVTYKVKKGTYYIRFERDWRNGSGKLNFTATFPSSSSSKTAKISYLSIEIPKDTTMQLGAVLSAKSDTKVTWSSSKSSVVSVNSKGKITAKKKGTAVITAKLGSSKMKIKIKVT